MPELPEVETMRRGISHHIVGKQIERIDLRNGRLRYPVDEAMLQPILGGVIESVERRAKYLLINVGKYRLLIHLGMTGVLHLLESEYPPRKHDHLIFHLSDGMALFYNDTRRFGSVQCFPRAASIPQLEGLAPEPLSAQFNVEYLTPILQARRGMIKPLLMNQRYVVGVGNIYANEALFLTGIHPKRAANSLSEEEIAQLIDNIQQILQAAIEKGGTTLKDFTNPDGNPGYFAQSLNIYGRAGEECPKCGTTIVREMINQRASFWCEKCQLESEKPS